MPHFNYSILSWGFDTNRLSKLQKRAIRIIFRSKYNSHMEPIMKSLKLLKIYDIITCQYLRFLKKFMHKHVPKFCQSLFLQNAAYHDIPTRQCHQIAIPYSHTSRARKCIRYHLPALLRKMPPCIVDKIYTHSLYGFSTYTKQYL